MNMRDYPTLHLKFLKILNSTENSEQILNIAENSEQILNITENSEQILNIIFLLKSKNHKTTLTTSYTFTFMCV
jgi:hypothetical protein